MRMLHWVIHVCVVLLWDEVIATLCHMRMLHWMIHACVKLLWDKVMKLRVRRTLELERMIRISKMIHVTAVRIVITREPTKIICISMMTKKVVRRIISRELTTIIRTPITRILRQLNALSIHTHIILYKRIRSRFHVLVARLNKI